MRYFIISLFFIIAFKSVLYSSSVIVKNISSSSYQGNKEKFKPEHAVDDKLNTRWSSDFSDPQWLMLEFEKLETIDKITIDWEMSYGKNYQIQGSKDGKSWYILYSTDNSDGAQDEICFLPVNIKYIRLFGMLRDKIWGYSIWEIKVFTSQKKPQALNTFKKFNPESILKVLKKNTISYYFYKAQHTKEGLYPKWLNNKFNFWTVIGHFKSTYESLLSDEGMIGTFKKNFSLCPYLYIDKKLVTPFDADKSAMLLTKNIFLLQLFNGILMGLF